MNKLTLTLSAMALALCGACGDDNGGTDGGACGVEANYASIHDNLLSQGCATAGCHSGAAAAGALDLAGGLDAVYAELTVEATTNTMGAQAMRVVANSSDDSFLYVKISDTTVPNGIMPPGSEGPPACVQAAVKAWIDGGAAR